MRGRIFFFSGPSGVGKGTLISALKERHPDWVFPASFTTREPRPGEKDGETYFFISQEKFREKILNGDFLEYAEVHGGNFYGTDKQKLLEPLKEGKTVIREFDVQGFEAARKKLDRKDYFSIFVKPGGGIDELVQRIKDRAPISDQELQKRINSMEREFALSDIYDEFVYSHDGEILKMIETTEDIIAQNMPS